MISLNSGNPMRVVLLSILVFEVIAFALSIPVMVFVSDVPAELAALAGGVAALVPLVAAGLLRRPGGYLVGWLAQLGGMALGLLTSAMFLVGIMFLGLWVLTFVLGKRLDAAAERRAA